jgi:ribosome-binding factor A
MAERRPERVGHLVQAELARALLTSVRDPRLRTVTVTAVRMTPDLRVARVYFRTLGDPGEREDVRRAFQKAAAFLRREVAHALDLRVAPELRVEYDDSPDVGRRIDSLLQSTHEPDGDGDE